MSGQEIVSTATQIVPAHEFKLVLSRAKTELEALIEEYKDLPLDVSNATAYAKVEHAWRKLYYPRIELDKKVEGTVKDLRAQVKSFQEEGKKIVGAWQAEENRLKAPLLAEDNRKKAEKAAKEAEKIARTEGIKKRINDLKLLPSLHVASSSLVLENKIMELQETTLDEGEFGEYHIEAVESLNSSIELLQTMHDAAISRERQEEENKRIAAVLEATRKAEANKLAAERAAFEAEQAKAKAEQEEREAIERKRAEVVRAKQESVLEEQRKELAAKQAVIDEANRKRQEELDRQAQAIADQQAEADRIEREKHEAEELKKREAQAEANEIEVVKFNLAKEAEYERGMKEMSVKAAFEEILVHSTDDYISDICRHQLIVLNSGSAAI